MLFSSRKTCTAVLAGLLALGFATETWAARTEPAAGFYRHSRGAVNIPLQFVLGGANRNMPIMFPNDDPMFMGSATLVGMGPAALTLPIGLQSGGYAALLPLTSPNVQITTSFTNIQAPVLGGMFAAGMGPGGFTFCPGSFAAPGGMAVCPPPTTGGSAMVPQPPQGAGTRNGRVVHVAGSNSFGGVSRHLLGGGGLVSRYRTGFEFGMAVVQLIHEAFGGAGGMIQVNGGATTAGQVTTSRTAGMNLTMFPAPTFPTSLIWPMGPNGTLASTNMLLGGPYTQPKTAPAMTTGTTIPAAVAGPFAATTTTGAMTIQGLTACPTTAGGTFSTMPAGGAFPNIPLAGPNACIKINTATNGALRQGPAGTTINTGFPFTTGTALAQQTTNTGAGSDFFTVTGSDNRTSRGIGNITLVAGGLSIRRTNIGPDRSTGSMETISLTLGKQVPAISPAGMAAAAVLMVLAAGYALRRRF